MESEGTGSVGLALYCLQAPAEMTGVHKHQSLIFIYASGEWNQHRLRGGSGGGGVQRSLHRVTEREEEKKCYVRITPGEEKGRD